MRLKEWLDAERGRYRLLAQALGVTIGRVSQMARSGVPKSHLIAVRDFTGGEVSIEEMLADESRAVRERDQDGLHAGHFVGPQLITVDKG